MRLSNQNAFLVIPELNKAQIRKTPNGLFSIYDLIQICSGVTNPYQSWINLTEQYPEVLYKIENFQFPGQGQRLTPVATLENCLYILGLLPGHCGKSYREKAANLVRRYLEGDAELGAEMIIRDKDDHRKERAQKRILVCETNKNVAKLAEKHQIQNYGKIHNDRYQGLYGKQAKQLKIDACIDKGTPLDYMSVYDLTLNSLVNLSALKNDSPSTIYEAAKGLREWHKTTNGEDLKPQWEYQELNPDNARKIAKSENEKDSNKQLSLF